MPDASPDETTPSESDGSGGRDRDVVVPMRLYKTVTVFSTLIAVLSVVVGFVFLDAATLRFSVLRRLVVLALSSVGLHPPDGLLNGVLAVVGLTCIGFGAGVYVLGSRFRAPGMGNSQEDSDEPSNDG